MPKMKILRFRPLQSTSTTAAILLGILLLAGPTRSFAQAGATNTYVCKEIGWTFEYPADWDVLSDEEIAVLEGKGREPMEKVLGGELEMLHKNLLYLRKDPFHIFTSSIQAYTDEVPYEEAQKEFFEIILESLRAAGITFDHRYGEAEVGGLKFATLEIDILNPRTKEVILHQVMHDRLFENGYSLLFSINYASAAEQKILEGMVKSSKFGESP